MSWTDAILHGLALGLILSFLIGPVFFLLLRLSIEQGAKQALVMDVGVLLGDVLYITLSYLGTANIFLNPLYAKPLGIIGSLILITTGLWPFIKKRNIQPQNIEIKSYHPITLALKGFVLNVTNPFVVFFWLAGMGYAVTTFDGKPVHILLYFVSCLGVYILIDLIKIYMAIKIRKYLTPPMITRIVQVSSLGVIILGAIMMYRVVNM